MSALLLLLATLCLFKLEGLEEEPAVQSMLVV